ncbi:serine-rich protein [Rutstroemia sp. NJR-2017a BVV2]|nr:serine-rich protein [Rutstroemia sp. NJR-2017a BVV2]
MNETPHQWSSQLSTVLSVSEGGTDRGSQQWSDDNGRRSSVVPSTPSRHSRGSRHILSVGSLSPEENLTHSRNDSLERPKPAYTRSGRGLSSSSIPVIGDTDEYGDGITAMQDLRTRPSRTRLSGLISVASSENLRSNTMLSTTSSRANSLLVSTIPTWARLYYGSGERRYLGGPPGSSYGPSEGPSRSNSFSMSSGSPDEEHFPNSLYSPRRRPREGHPHARGQSMQESVEITPAPTAQGPVQRTWSMISSVWSPHLRVDRRAARHSMWEPPAVSWSTEGGVFGRRNIQVVLFIAGFLLPFAWMIAAFLPLPRMPTLEMREQQNSAPQFDANANSSSTGLTDYAREFGPLDEARFESAKWWRMLNRWMSIVGLLIIAAIVSFVSSHFYPNERLISNRSSSQLKALKRDGNLSLSPSSTGRFFGPLRSSHYLTTLSLNYSYTCVMCMAIYSKRPIGIYDKILYTRNDDSTIMRVKTFVCSLFLLLETGLEDDVSIIPFLLGDMLFVWMKQASDVWEGKALTLHG